jgi:hypothetical protein
MGMDTAGRSMGFNVQTGEPTSSPNPGSPSFMRLQQYGQTGGFQPQQYGASLQFQPAHGTRLQGVPLQTGAAVSDSTTTPGGTTGTAALEEHLSKAPSARLSNYQPHKSQAAHTPVLSTSSNGTPAAEMQETRDPDSEATTAATPESKEKDQLKSKGDCNALHQRHTLCCPPSCPHFEHKQKYTLAHTH